jgi:hypothetical protein
LHGLDRFALVEVPRAHQPLVGGRAFGYIAYPPRPDGEPTFNEGYIFDGEDAFGMLERSNPLDQLVF